MLKEGSGFKKVYIACGRTDLRRGIDGLARIIRFQFKLDPYDKILCFYFADKRMTASKGFYGKVMVFCFFIKELKKAVSNGHVRQKKFWKSLHSSIKC